MRSQVAFAAKVGLVFFACIAVPEILHVKQSAMHIVRCIYLRLSGGVTGDVVRLLCLVLTQNLIISLVGTLTVEPGTEARPFKFSRPSLSSASTQN
jgi:hypothetical protein